MSNIPNIPAVPAIKPQNITPKSSIFLIYRKFEIFEFKRTIYNIGN